MTGDDVLSLFLGVMGIGMLLLAAGAWLRERSA